MTIPSAGDLCREAPALLWRSGSGLTPRFTRLILRSHARLIARSALGGVFTDQSNIRPTKTGAWNTRSPSRLHAHNARNAPFRFRFTTPEGPELVEWHPS